MARSGLVAGGGRAPATLSRRGWRPGNAAGAGAWRCCRGMAADSSRRWPGPGLTVALACGRWRMGPSRFSPLGWRGGCGGRGADGGDVTGGGEGGLSRAEQRMLRWAAVERGFRALRFLSCAASARGDFAPREFSAVTGVGGGVGAGWLVRGGEQRGGDSSLRGGGPGERRMAPRCRSAAMVWGCGDAACLREVGCGNGVEVVICVFARGRFGWDGRGGFGEGRFAAAAGSGGP